MPNFIKNYPKSHRYSAYLTQLELFRIDLFRRELGFNSRSGFSTFCLKFFIYAIKNGLSLDQKKKKTIWDNWEKPGKPTLELSEAKKLFMEVKDDLLKELKEVLKKRNLLKNQVI